MKYLTIKKYLLVKSGLEDSLGRIPTNMELAEEMGISIEDLVEIQNYMIDIDEDDEVELSFKISVHNEKLKKLRLQRGLTLIQLGEKMGVPIQSVAHIERCSWYPHEETIQKYCDFFRKTREELFPEWLKFFTKNWKEQEKEKTVKFNTVSLQSGYAQNLIESPDKLFENADRELYKARIIEYFYILSPREKKILEMRFGLNGDSQHTLKEIAKYFDVKGPRIQQIETKAIEKIKNLIYDTR